MSSENQPASEHRQAPEPKLASDFRPQPKKSFTNFGMPLSWMFIPLLLIVAGAIWWALSNDTPDSQLPPPVISAQPEHTESGAADNFAPIERSPEIPGTYEASSEAESAPVNEPAPSPAPSRPKIELPTLSNSDAPIKALASELSPDGKLLAFLVPDSILLKVVRMVIALDEHAVVKDYRPLASPEPGMLLVAINEELDPAIGQRYRMDPRNYERYTAHVELLSKLEMARLAQIYHDYYPLLEQAYEQYGVDRGSFYEVTQRALNNILEVPIREESPALIQPKVFFQYQDPIIEERTMIDKWLMRMGPENTLRLQAQLRTLKMELERQKP